MRIIRANERGQMVTSELVKAIREEKDAGRYPLLVNGTAGTTVLGAIDELDEIADVCQREGIWLHVDVSFQETNLRQLYNVKISNKRIHISGP